jgi:hypothetical protein
VTWQTVETDEILQADIKHLRESNNVPEGRIGGSSRSGLPFLQLLIRVPAQPGRVRQVFLGQPASNPNAMKLDPENDSERTPVVVVNGLLRHKARLDPTPSRVGLPRMA